MLVNAQHIKQVPAARRCGGLSVVADLLRHGLIRASFVPLRRSVICAN